MTCSSQHSRLYSNPGSAPANPGSVPTGRRIVPDFASLNPGYGSWWMRADSDSTRRHVAERVDDAVDYLLDQGHVFALAGDPNNRLGTGRAYDQPAVTIETLLAARNCRAHSRILVGFSIPVADVLGDLRERIEAMTDHRNWFADPPDHGQHLQGRDETVARGGVV